MNPRQTMQSFEKMFDTAQKGGCRYCEHPVAVKANLVKWSLEVANGPGASSRVSGLRAIMISCSNPSVDNTDRLHMYHRALSSGHHF